MMQGGIKQQTFKFVEPEIDIQEDSSEIPDHIKNRVKLGTAFKFKRENSTFCQEYA